MTATKCKPQMRLLPPATRPSVLRPTFHAQSRQCVGGYLRRRVMLGDAGWRLRAWGGRWRNNAWGGASRSKEVRRTALGAENRSLLASSRDTTASTRAPTRPCCGPSTRLNYSLLHLCSHRTPIRNHPPYSSLAFSTKHVLLVVIRPFEDPHPAPCLSISRNSSLL